MALFKKSTFNVIRSVTGISRQFSKPASKPQQSGSQSQLVFDRENKYGAHNYHPLPVALSKGKGKYKCVVAIKCKKQPYNY